MDKVGQDKDEVLKSMRSAAFPNTWRFYFSSRLLLHSQFLHAIHAGKRTPT